MFENFFITDVIPANAEKGTFVPLLVFASYIIASFGSYIGLTIASSITGAASGKIRNIHHAFGAFALGSGIWAMHFVGMLAFKTKMLVAYDPWLTVLSMIIAIAIAYGVLYIARSERLSAWKLIAGALALGAAICAMHYTGMEAMQMDADLRYKPGLFIISYLIAVIASGAALWIVFVLGRREASNARHVWQVIAALIMGGAICGMHYTGMAAAVFLPYANCRHDADQSFVTLALAVVAIVSIIFGISLIFSFTAGRHTGRDKEYPFPIKLLSFASVLTLFAVLWASGNGFYFDHKMTHDVQRNLDISDIGDQISYLDTLNAHALKMLTVTGDPEWEKKYLEGIRQSNEDFGQLKTITRDEDVSFEEGKDLYQRAQELDKNTDFFLQASEAKVIELVHESKLADARAILSGAEYTTRKQDYSDNLHKLDEDTSGILVHTLLSLARTSSYSLYPGIVVITLLPIAWYFSFQSIRRWREELENARRALIKNEKELQKSIGEIELSQTQALKAHEAAVQAKEIAEKASASKSEFLANMSHELRTPLNSILGMLRLLKEAKLSEEEHGLAETAFRSSTNLLEIVNDILDLSKIEAGEMRLERIGMDPNYALYSVVLTLDHIAREKQVSLTWHKDKEKFPYVMGDPTRFVRILTNLVGNAIKYTDKGRVDIRAFSKKLDDKHIEFRCEIMDTGIGIPKEKLQSVFEKFVQADTSTTRKYGGTGLGLAITRQLVELMNGTIGVESEVGVGSTFWITIPFEITDKLSEEKQTRKKKMVSGTISPSAARVLVAEDHPMNQILMTKLLKRFNIGSFEIVENGVQVVKRYQEDPWDVILMDCHMPEKNGYDATEDIRKLEKETSNHVPIVAMTANAMVGDKEKCLRYGMDEYISKPINIDVLKETLGQWIYFEDFAESEKNNLTSSMNAPVDLAQIKSFSEGDGEMEKELVRVFIEQSDMNLQSLEDHKTDGGSKEWQGSAHMFKGGAAGMGAKGLSSLCNQAQNFTGTAQEQSALYEKIKSEYIRVKEYFKKMELLS